MSVKHCSFYLSVVIIILVACCIGCNKRHHIEPSIQNNSSLQAIKDIQYGINTDWKGNTEHLTMDIYEPTNMEKGKKYPLVLFLHGGGFLAGDKRSAAAKCSILADSGFVAVSMNYRTGWNKTD